MRSTTESYKYVHIFYVELKDMNKMRNVCLDKQGLQFKLQIITSVNNDLFDLVVLSCKDYDDHFKAKTT